MIMIQKQQIDKGLLMKLKNEYAEFSEVGNQQDKNIDQTLVQQTAPSTYLQLFSFADRLDIILMTIASLFSIGNGVSIVFYSLPIGELVGAFSGEKTNEQIVSAVLKAMLGFLINSVVVFFNCWFMTAIWTVTSERQMTTARKMYYQALLAQQQSWHDRNRPVQLCEKMYVQISKVHQSLITNMTSLLTKVSMGCAGVIIALATGWKMALVMIAFIPAMMVSGFVRGHYEKKKQFYFQTKKVRNDSGIIEIFDNIKTIKMLNGQNYEYDRYHKIITKQEQEMWQQGKKGALAFSLFFFCIIMNYTLGFWYGSKLVSERQINTNTGEPYGISEVIIIFFTLYISNLNLSGLPDNFAQFSMSRYSMGKILLIINRKPKIKYGYSDLSPQIQCINLKNISFEYDQPLFQSLDLNIKEGVTTLVGPSGCGKSTITSLLMRFYDPIQGQISFVTSNKIQVDIKSLSEENLRSIIGYVGQQPVLIGNSIRQALLATQLSDSQIYKTLDVVNSSSFVKSIGLDQSFTSLSGGQKQRIAIARALLRKPTILILDESTSALDRNTEEQVLQQLRKVGIKFIIMIAHRTQTISKSDTVIKVQKGKIAFSGSYPEYEQHINQNSDMQQKQEQLKAQQLVQQDGNNGNSMHNDSHRQQQIRPVSAMEQIEVKEQQPNEQNKYDFKMSYICRLMKLNVEYKHMYILGAIGAIYFGCIFPVFSLILSRIIIILSKVPAAHQHSIIQLQNQVNNLTLGLFLISIGSLLFTTTRWLSFEYLTCKLASKAKLSAFHKAINKEYIQLENQGAEFSHIIVKNCENLKQLAGNFMPTIIQNALTLIAGLVIAFIYSWAMSLVALGVLPLVLLASKMMMAFNHGMQSNTEQKHKNNHILVVESITNIKTVRSCALEKKLYSKFQAQLKDIVQLSVKYGNLGGIMFGIGQTLIFCMIAVIFFIGALLIKSGLIGIEDMYVSVIAIMFAGVQAGGNLFFLSQLAPAKYGACKYFQLMGEQDDILISQPDPDQDNLKLQDQISEWKGSLKFQNINFKYQSRKDALFKNLNFEVKNGEKVAIVGQSGSGKSTLVNLLFKLYIPTSGRILIDDVQSKYISRKSLSNILGIVMQEPVLFNRSVYENIRYNTYNLGIQDVIKAAKQSYAHQFIIQKKFGNKNQQITEQSDNQPHTLNQDQLEGYWRNVGTKGSYLSGGQKQRVAIARSLVRNPKILILDQATSALDPQNQKLVQTTLEEIKGMSQIIIAHRLSTIRNCDRIYVMNEGRIVESGSYDQLMNQGSWFKDLVSAKVHKNIVV